MRRILGFLAVIGLVAAFSPTTAAAAAPIRDSISTTGLRCDALPTDAGLAYIYVEGGFASLAIATSGTPEAIPNIITESGSASFDGSRLEATFDLVTVEESENPEVPPTFTPAGSGRLEAVLTPDGNPEDISFDPQRTGNIWDRGRVFSQRLTVEGTLSVELLDGTSATTDLTDCGAGTLIQTEFVTNPNAFVIGGNQRLMECGWTTAAGSVELRALTDDFGTDFSELIIFTGDGVLVGLTSPDYEASSYGAFYDVIDPALKGEIVGSATAAAVLSPSGERVNEHEWVDGTRYSLVGDVMSADGTLAITVDGTTTLLTMEDATCDATDVRVKVVERTNG